MKGRRPGHDVLEHAVSDFVRQAQPPQRYGDRVDAPRLQVGAAKSAQSLGPRRFEALLARVERGREARRQLHGRLCRLGVLLRLLTFLNGLALLGAASYSMYAYGMAEVSNTSLAIEWRVRAGVEYALMALSGLFLLCLERAATTDEPRPPHRRRRRRARCDALAAGSKRTAVVG